MSRMFTVCRRCFFGLVLLAVVICSAGAGVAGAGHTQDWADTKWTRQVLYLPVYSHVFHGNQNKRGPRFFDLSVTVSIRNTSENESITLQNARYMDSKGGVAHTYLEKPLVLAPLSSHEFFVDERDSVGGVGASFILVWESEVPVSEPVLEAVMIGTKSSQGISFITHGRVLSGAAQTE